MRSRVLIALLIGILVLATYTGSATSASVNVATDADVSSLVAEADVGAGAPTNGNAKTGGANRAEYIKDASGRIPGVEVNIKNGETITEFVDKALITSSFEVGKAPIETSFVYRFSDNYSDDGAGYSTNATETKIDYSLKTEAELDAIFSNDYYIERMKELGFYKTEDSGDQSLNLRNAITRLQSSINAQVTGELDLLSKKAALEGGGVFGYDRVELSPSSGYWIVINKSTRVLTVYEGDEVHKKYPVAVGRTISLTPDGKYSFIVKSVNPAWGGGGYASPVAGGSPSNPLGPRWMGISIGGGGRYGVHGNASPRSIGTYASAGCVRMINADVIELYDYIPVGTKVWIGTTEKLESYGVYQRVVDPLSGDDASALLPVPEPEQERDDIAVKIELVT